MRDEETVLQTGLMSVQNKPQSQLQWKRQNRKGKLEAKLSRIEALKTQGTTVRSGTRWYEYGEKNNKYFFSLEKTRYRRKHVTSIINHADKRIADPKNIFQEEELFFKEMCTSKNIDPQLPEFSDFFEDIENILPEEEAETCEGEITLNECYNALKSTTTNKSQGSDGFTAKFYHHFWNLIANYMGESFNYAIQNGILSISQRQGVIPLIPKRKRI